MKNILFFFLIIFFYSCSESVIKPLPVKECEIPDRLTDPNADIMYGHGASKLSPDGSKMFISIWGEDFDILDLKTSKVIDVDIQSVLPKNWKLGSAIAGVAFWCPYNSSIFAVIILAGIDTVGDGKQYPGRYHIIKTNIEGTLFEDITPKIFDPIGSLDPIGCDGWLPTSKEGNDTFLIGYKTSYFGGSKYAKFCPQNQTLFEIERTGLISFSNNGKYVYRSKFDYSIPTMDHKYFFINNTEIAYKDAEYTEVRGGFFSPDGKKLLLNTWFFDTETKIDSQRLGEVWIIDIEKFMANPVNPYTPDKIINIKDRFCMFSTGTPGGSFTSNNTISVSMFKKGENFQYLYEIDLNGNMIRQLTFVP